MKERTLRTIIVASLMVVALIFAKPVIALAEEMFPTLAEDGYYYVSEETKAEGLFSNDDGTFYFVDGEMQTGWQLVDGTNYYFSPAMATGLTTIGDDTYVFDNDGNLLTGIQEIDGSVYYVNESGIIESGWKTVDGKEYYFAPELKTGLTEIDGLKYYLDETGKMVTGWVKIDGKPYYFYSSTAEGSKTHLKGAMLTGWAIKGSDRYYFDSKTLEHSSGYKTIDGIPYYFDPETGAVKTGWYEFEGNRYYVNPSDFKAAQGWKVFDGTPYYFYQSTASGDANHKKGALLQGFASYEGKRYYYTVDGNTVSGTQVIDGIPYTFDEDGALVAGWYEYEGNRYYVTPVSFKLAQGWNLIDGKPYYFYQSTESGNPNHTKGALLQGFATYKGTRYYYTVDGNFATGLQYVDGIPYMFDEDGAMLTGWVKINGNKHFYYSNFTMAQGWKKINSVPYYFYKSTEEGSTTHVLGAMLTGWTTYEGSRMYYDPVKLDVLTGWNIVDDKEYFFYETTTAETETEPAHIKGSALSGWANKGSLTFYYSPTSYTKVIGWQKIDGITYYFWKSTESGSSYHIFGNLARNTTIDGKKLDADGVYDPVKYKMFTKAKKLSSSSKYLILVDTKNCKVGIFEGKKGNWKMIKYWKCSPGKKSTPTVIGTFKIQGRRKYFVSGTAYCHWATGFYGNYMFHSTLYNKNGTHQDSRLGMNLSHGCVRLDIKNAKWIYDNVPRGTKVVVYKK